MLCDDWQLEHEGRSSSTRRCRLHPDAPTVRLGESARDCETKAASAPDAGSPLERVEDPVSVGLGDTGASVVNADDGPSRGRSGQHFDRIGRGRELQGVLDQVDEHPLDVRCVDAKRRQVRWQRHLNTIGVRAELLERPRQQRVHRPQLRLAQGRTGFEPREIKEVFDESLEAAHLDPNRLEELSPLHRA